MDTSSKTNFVALNRMLAHVFSGIYYEISLEHLIQDLHTRSDSSPSLMVPCADVGHKVLKYGWFRKKRRCGRTIVDRH